MVCRNEFGLLQLSNSNTLLNICFQPGLETIQAKNIFRQNYDHCLST